MKFKTINSYKLYVGLNDRDSYKQIIKTEDAMKIVKDIVCEFIGGATFSKAEGYWEDENGNPTRENTIIIEIVNFDRDDRFEDVIAYVAEDLKVALNQNCIMIEKSERQVTYF